MLPADALQVVHQPFFLSHPSTRSSALFGRSKEGSVVFVFVFVVVFVFDDDHDIIFLCVMESEMLTMCFAGSALAQGRIKKGSLCELTRSNPSHRERECDDVEIESFPFPLHVPTILISFLL